jgi:cellulose synthase/poly-beta-1,6-N-acetylglucosamine synthase-like glycosyltransferase
MFEHSVMIISLFIYVSCSILLMTYGFHCYMMVGLFYGKQKNARKKIEKKVKEYLTNISPENLPFVTVQLPVYNESEVIRRLIDSAAKLDYPKNKFEIQVVDDSKDETIAMIDNIIAEYKVSGVDIYAVRREGREHFKAGALANAIKCSKGEYTAIFDSDFIIPSNFLKRAMAQIDGQSNVACVQARWGHINRFENWLTRAQSIGIDGHFAAEQGARSYNNYCMNFNGTAGVWRIKAIDDAGGWSGDTITEDLDLSYRVQLEGYIITYDYDLVCPAELPNNVIALKSQQKRWAKGSMETAIKLLPTIFKSKRLNFSQKVEAFMHLTHYSVSFLMVILSIFTLPVILLTPKLYLGWLLPVAWTLIVLSTLAPCTLYTSSGALQKKGLFSLLHFPLMVTVGTGLCVNNAIAVVEAIVGKKSDFIRTPKSGSSDQKSKKGSYGLSTKMFPAFAEILLGLYCAYTFLVYLSAKQYFFGFFIGAYALGLVLFGSRTLFLLVKNMVSLSREQVSSIKDGKIETF